MIEIKAKGGARYTVPVTIDPARMEDLVTVRFRVGDVYKDHCVNVYFDDERVQHVKKRIMAPGEMEQVILEKAVLQEIQDLREIRVCTEVVSK